MPTIQEQKFSKLLKLWEVAQDSLTRQEFLDSFKNVINLVLKQEKTSLDKINQALASLNASFSDLKGKTDEYTTKRVNEAINTLQSQVEKVMKEEENLMNFIRDKAARIKEGHDGDDGYTPIKGIDYFDGKPGKDGSPDTADQIINKISGLLEIRDIKNLREELDELRKIREERRFFGGGGFSKMAMDSKIIDPYTPTGTINGVNCDFVLVKAPNPTASLKVYRGGAKKQLNPTGTTDGDYSLSGKTITFNVAPLVGEIIEVEHRI